MGRNHKHAAPDRPTMWEWITWGRKVRAGFAQGVTAMSPTSVLEDHYRQARRMAGARSQAGMQTK